MHSRTFLPRALVCAFLQWLPATAEGRKRLFMMQERRGGGRHDLTFSAPLSSIWLYFQRRYVSHPCSAQLSSAQLSPTTMQLY